MAKGGTEVHVWLLRRNRGEKKDRKRRRGWSEFSIMLDGLSLLSVPSSLPYCPHLQSNA